MTDKKRKLVLIFGIITVIIAAIGCAMLVLAVNNEFEADIGHFAADAKYAPFAMALMALGVPLGIALPVAVGKAKIKHGRSAGMLLCFISVFTAALLLAASIFTIFDDSVKVDRGYSFLPYVSMLLGVAGAIAMLTFAVSGSYRTIFAQAISFAIPLYFIIRVLILYFDQEAAINSSVKIMTQIAFISFALFFTFDSGLYVGKDKILRRYLFGSVVALTVGAPVAVASLVTMFTHPGCFELNVVDSCMVSAIVLTIAAKLHHIAFSVTADEADEQAEEEHEAEPENEDKAEAEIEEENE